MQRKPSAHLFEGAKLVFPRTGRRNIDVDETMCLFFGLQGFYTQIKISRPVRQKTGLEKVWSYFHRRLANHVFPRTGRRKRLKHPRRTKGAQANPIKTSRIIETYYIQTCIYIIYFYICFYKFLYIFIYFYIVLQVYIYIYL